VSSNVLTKEYKFSLVYAFLGKALRMKVEPTVCKDNDFQCIVDRRWRAYMDEDIVDELYERLHDQGMFLEYFNDKVRNHNYEFLAVNTKR